jgi:hypothetical protein
MEGTGFSIWIIVMLIALLFVVLWGALFVFLAFGTWFISRAGLPDERRARRGRNEWDDL